MSIKPLGTWQMIQVIAALLALSAVAMARPRSDFASVAPKQERTLASVTLEECVRQMLSFADESGDPRAARFVSLASCERDSEVSGWKFVSKSLNSEYEFTVASDFKACTNAMYENLGRIQKQSQFGVLTGLKCVRGSPSDLASGRSIGSYKLKAAVKFEDSTRHYDLYQLLVSAQNGKQPSPTGL